MKVIHTYKDKNGNIVATLRLKKVKVGKRPTNVHTIKKSGRFYYKSRYINDKDGNMGWDRVKKAEALNLIKSGECIWFKPRKEAYQESIQFMATNGVGYRLDCYKWDDGNDYRAYSVRVFSNLDSLGEEGMLMLSIIPVDYATTSRNALNQAGKKYFKDWDRFARLGKDTPIKVKI